jgi:hypothetical protein
MPGSANRSKPEVCCLDEGDGRYRPWPGNDPADLHPGRGKILGNPKEGSASLVYEPQTAQFELFMNHFAS